LPTQPSAEPILLKLAFNSAVITSGKHVPEVKLTLYLLLIVCFAIDAVNYITLRKKHGHFIQKRTGVSEHKK